MSIPAERTGSEVRALIEAAEDMADVRAAEDARAEMAATGEMAIPWDEVKVHLCLTSSALRSTGDRDPDE